MCKEAAGLLGDAKYQIMDLHILFDDQIVDSKLGAQSRANYQHIE